MKTDLAARAAAFSLALLLTVVMLGSMDYLATSEPAPGAVMAVVNQPRG